MNPFDPIQLEGSLLLRAATPEDADRLADFNIRIHSDDPESPEKALGVWTRDLLTRPHPTFRPELTTIVEDPANGKIVSSALTIPQTWTYGGIAFGVGRPELIGTDPEYRGRGLVRAQMDVLHRLSDILGHSLQAITGIPWFYRQFGYEMALDLMGGRIGYNPTLPKPGDHDKDLYRFRPAVRSDAAFLNDIYASSVSNQLVACIRNRSGWEYELAGKSTDNLNRQEVFIIETQEAKPVGYAVSDPSLVRKLAVLSQIGLTAGTSWIDAGPALFNWLRKRGGNIAERTGEPCKGVYLRLGSTHPLYELHSSRLPNKRPPYAWYIRIPDLPKFIERVGPVLEKRLEGTALKSYSGKVKLNFYRTGVSMHFNSGKLVETRRWQPGSEDYGDARFPDLTFLSLLFGRKSFSELSDFFPDCSANDLAAALLETLFPKTGSNVWPVE